MKKLATLIAALTLTQAQDVPVINIDTSSYTGASNTTSWKAHWDHTGTNMFKLDWPIGTNLYTLSLTTNTFTNWVSFERSPSGVEKQMGRAQTNLVMLITNQRDTNGIILEVLGTEEFFTKTRYQINTNK